MSVNKVKMIPLSLRTFKITYYLKGNKDPSVVKKDVLAACQNDEDFRIKECSLQQNRLLILEQFQDNVNKQIEQDFMENLNVFDKYAFEKNLNEFN